MFPSSHKSDNRQRYIKTCLMIFKRPTHFHMFMIGFLPLASSSFVLLFLKHSKTSKKVVPTRWGMVQICAEKLHQIAVISTQCQIRICALTCTLRAIRVSELHCSGMLGQISTASPCADTRQATGLPVEVWEGIGWNFCEFPGKARVTSVYPRQAWLGKPQMQLTIQMFLL